MIVFWWIAEHSPFGTFVTPLLTFIPIFALMLALDPALVWWEDRMRAHYTKKKRRKDAR